MADVSALLPRLYSILQS